MKTSLKPRNAPPIPLPSIAASFFGKFNFNINFEIASKDTVSSSDNIECTATIYRPSDGKSRQVMVNVTVAAAKGKKVPYELEAEAVIIFEDCDEATDSRDMDEHALKLGAPIAFGMIREQLIVLSARSPFHAFLLPMVPMRKLVEEYKLVTDEDIAESEEEADSKE